MAGARHTHEPRPGQQAPPFTLPDPEGNSVALSELLGQGPVVLFFVPHAPRGVCKRTQCQLRDAYSEFEAHGARILGIAPQGKGTLRRTMETQRLPYPILSDRDQTVHHEYGVENGGLVPARATFVLDAKGTIQWVERNPLLAGRHSQGALRAVQRLGNQ